MKPFLFIRGIFTMLLIPLLITWPSVELSGMPIQSSGSPKAAVSPRSGGCGAESNVMTAAIIGGTITLGWMTAGIVKYVDGNDTNNHLGAVFYNTGLACLVITISTMTIISSK